jgi:glycerophosphoryl diester phosphodiesterase
MAVVPWTIDDPATMESLIDAGVDGLITNYPDRLRDLLAELGGYKLPKPAHQPSGVDCIAEVSQG